MSNLSGQTYAASCLVKEPFQRGGSVLAITKIAELAEPSDNADELVMIA